MLWIFMNWFYECWKSAAKSLSIHDKFSRPLALVFVIFMLPEVGETMSRGAARCDVLMVDYANTGYNIC